MLDVPYKWDSHFHPTSQQAGITGMQRLPFCNQADHRWQWSHGAFVIRILVSAGRILNELDVRNFLIDGTCARGVATTDPRTGRHSDIDALRYSPNHNIRTFCNARRSSRTLSPDDQRPPRLSRLMGWYNIPPRGHITTRPISITSSIWMVPPSGKKRSWKR